MGKLLTFPGRPVYIVDATATTPWDEPPNPTVGALLQAYDAALQLSDELADAVLDDGTATWLRCRGDELQNLRGRVADGLNRRGVR